MNRVEESAVSCGGSSSRHSYVSREIGRQTGSCRLDDSYCRTPTLVGACDLYQEGNWEWPPFFLRRRSEVVEILVEEGILLALANSGVCAAFRLGSLSRLGFVNLEADEVIRSIFFNRLRRELIVASVGSADGYRGLRCRAVSLACIKAGQTREPPDARWLFQGEQLIWPGFVEFDDVNARVLTFCAFSRHYKLWGMSNYQQLFSISGRGVQGVYLGDGALLVVRQQREGLLPLEVRSVADGSLLKEFSLPLAPSRQTPELLQLFHGWLLVRPSPSDPLSITDICQGSQTEIPPSELGNCFELTLSVLNRTMVAFQREGLTLYDFKGQRVGQVAGCTVLSPHSLFHISRHETHMAVFSSGGEVGGGAGARVAEGPQGSGAPGAASTAQQRMQPPAQQSGSGGGPSRAARCLGLVDLRRCCWAARLCCRDGGGEESATGAELQSVTALFYDEACRTIYTGAANGRVHAWSC